MSDSVNWNEWAPRLHGMRGHAIATRAVEVLLQKRTVAALWISGSRAVGASDEHSDMDIRIHAPGWMEKDFEDWVEAVEGAAVRWRLSKLGPGVWNYECLFSRDIPVDLLVFAAAEAPVVSTDSVVFKMQQPLKHASGSLLVKETSLEGKEGQALVDGAEIDLQKFTKLFARGERLGALFLLEAVRFSALRLAYVAVRGKDCGPKAVHTLASLKAIRRTIGEEGGDRGNEWLRQLEVEGPLEESASVMKRLVQDIAERLRWR